jgi:hypothetical protein
VLSGGALYYYVIDEYRVSNELLTEDIYVSYPPPSLSIHHRKKDKQDTDDTGIRQALQSAVSRIEGYVKSLEEKVRK